MNPLIGAFFRAVPNGIVGPEIIGVPGPKFFPGVFVTDRFAILRFLDAGSLNSGMRAVPRARPAAALTGRRNLGRPVGAGPELRMRAARRELNFFMLKHAALGIFGACGTFLIARSFFEQTTSL